MIKFFKIFLIIFFVLISKSVLASDIKIEKMLPQSGEISVGDEMLVNFSLESEGEVQNALEGVITASNNLEILNVVTGNSIVSIWLENPSKFTGDKINFSGVIPAGYNNESGQIFSIVLRAKETGVAKITLSGASTFLNDGLGTEEKVIDKTLSFGIKKAISGKEPYKISVKDVNAPEDFTVELLKDDNLFEGNWALVFTGRDLGSGLKEYEVLEGHKVFKQVTSPYLLENQRLNEKIYVRAIDNEGNIKLVRVLIPHKVCVGVRCFNEVSFVVVVLGIIVTLWFIKRKILHSK